MLPPQSLCVAFGSNLFSNFLRNNLISIYFIFCVLLWKICNCQRCVAEVAILTRGILPEMWVYSRLTGVVDKGKFLTKETVFLSTSVASKVILLMLILRLCKTFIVPKSATK